MKLKLRDLWQAKFVFEKFFNKGYDDIKLSYALSKMAKKVNAEIDEIDKARLELVKKHAEKDEKGNPKIDMGRFVLKNQERFNKEFADLLETEIEIDIWQIPWRAVEEVKLTPNEFTIISGFVKIEEETPPKTKKVK